MGHCWACLRACSWSFPPPTTSANQPDNNAMLLCPPGGPWRRGSWSTCCSAAQEAHGRAPAADMALFKIITMLHCRG